MQFIYRTSYFRIEANAEANKVITVQKIKTALGDIETLVRTKNNSPIRGI
jgi:hypothetical protein